MAKLTITQKRATLFKEWVLATLANDESYYFSTISLGIPDGDSIETVMEDLQDGFYDDNIDETIEVYTDAKEAFGKSGYFVGGKVYADEAEAIEASGIRIPERIYIKH